MSVILNEREYAERLLADNDLTQKPIEALTVVARYYYSEGYKRKEISRLLETYITKSDASANIVRWHDVIERLSRSAGKYPLVEIDSIQITEDEISVCRQLKGKQWQRLMFSLICFAKYYNAISDTNNGWTNRPDKEIFRAANVTTPISRQSLMLNDLRAAGLIEFSKKVDSTNIRVTCLDYDGPVVLHITDFRNLGNQYSMLLGEPYMECESCGAVVRRTGRRQKYCKTCAPEINRISTLQKQAM